MTVFVAVYELSPDACVCF